MRFTVNQPSYRILDIAHVIVVNSARGIKQAIPANFLWTAAEQLSMVVHRNRNYTWVHSNLNEDMPLHNTNYMGNGTQQYRNTAKYK